MNTQSQWLILGARASGDFVALDGEERRRHLYIVGQTGTGKSTLLVNLLRQDFESGAGLIEDPDYALAMSGLSDTYSLLSWYGDLPPAEAMPKATTRQLSGECRLGSVAGCPARHSRLSDFLSMIEEAMTITPIIFVLVILLFGFDSAGQVKTRRKHTYG